MNPEPNTKPAPKEVKRQLIFAVLIGLIVGSAMIFFVAWSSTKNSMEQQKAKQSNGELENTEKPESQHSAPE